VRKEDDPVPYGGLVKAPKILADTLESIAATVFIDVNYDVKRLWEVCVYLMWFLSLVPILRYMILKLLIKKERKFCRSLGVFWSQYIHRMIYCCNLNYHFLRFFA